MTYFSFLSQSTSSDGWRNQVAVTMGLHANVAGKGLRRVRQRKNPPTQSCVVKKRFSCYTIHQTSVLSPTRNLNVTYVCVLVVLCSLVACMDQGERHVFVFRPTTTCMCDYQSRTIDVRILDRLFNEHRTLLHTSLYYLAKYILVYEDEVLLYPLCETPPCMHAGKQAKEKKTCCSVPSFGNRTGIFYNVG